MFRRSSALNKPQGVTTLAFEDKSRDELVRMVETLRARVLELEGAEARRRQVEKIFGDTPHLDALTGLYNRNAFFALAVQQLRVATRMRRPMLMLYCRVNGLEQMAEVLGLKEANRALAHAARIARETYREADIAARIDRDAFAVLAIEADAPHEKLLVERLKGRLSQQRSEAKEPYGLSMSVGVAHWDPERPCTVRDLLTAAEEDMYARDPDSHFD
jgi:diguanylate cyclase (GGDEF)-like protein